MTINQRGSGVGGKIFDHQQGVRLLKRKKQVVLALILVSVVTIIEPSAISSRISVLEFD